jgi:hypothetical protein
VEVWGEFFQMKFKQDRRRNEKLAGTKIQIGDDRKKKGRRTEIRWQITGIVRAPPPKNVGRLIYEYVDRKKKDTFFTTNLL